MSCHEEADKIDKSHFLGIVAVRENTLQDWIEEVLRWLWSLPKYLTDAELSEAVAELTPGAASLAERTLREAGAQTEEKA